MTQNLATALVAFQAEMPTVLKGNTANVPTKAGGSYSYTYADLADVTEAAMPLLTKHGLAFIAKPRMTERGYELVGTLLHTSGEREEGALQLGGNTPQEIGSAITYARRYLLGCMTGIVTDDDDDGNLAQTAKPQSRSGPLASEKQLNFMHMLFTSLDILDDAKPAFVEQTIGRQPASATDMTINEASKVIERLKGMEPPKRADRVKAADVDTSQPDPWTTAGGTA